MNTCICMCRSSDTGEGNFYFTGKKCSELFDQLQSLSQSARTQPSTSPTSPVPTAGMDITTSMSYLQLLSPNSVPEHESTRKTTNNCMHNIIMHALRIIKLTCCASNFPGCEITAWQRIFSRQRIFSGQTTVCQGIFSFVWTKCLDKSWQTELNFILNP